MAQFYASHRSQCAAIVRMNKKVLVFGNKIACIKNQHYRHFAVTVVTSARRYCDRACLLVDSFVMLVVISRKVKVGFS